MEIEPNKRLYPGFKIVAPDDTETPQLIGFARQFALWAEGKFIHENALERINRRVSREGSEAP